MIRLVASLPFLIGGEIITSLGYRIAGANHLNPHRRTS